ncbi:MAG TPA: peptidoglycan-associated lipoprotein Pal [Fibrobacteria bacterium]|nr:peptidoglycan-associated lipoprotein Pal [Fibrobacteria bacterium]
MKSKYLALVGLVGLVAIGCSKKPKPEPVEPPPPRVEAPPPPPPQPETPRVDEEALRRQRIQARIAEVFKPVYFAYDQSTLSAEGRATLQEIGKLMKEVPEISARIEGHADERGTNEYNLALGERRSITVQDYLVSFGVSKAKLQTISYGEEKPAQVGTDESAWSKNRRVEFTTTF